MDDSAFDFSLSYDDAGYNNVGDNQEENNLSGITSTKRPDKRRGVRANLTSDAPKIQLEQNSDLSGRQYDSLDWFLNENDFMLAKRQKEKQVDIAADNLILKIVNEKNRHKRKSLDFQFRQNDPHSSALTPVIQTKVLKYPPMNGIEWFGVSSSDGNIRAYLSIRVRNAPLEATHKFRTTKFVDREQ